MEALESQVADLEESLQSQQAEASDVVEQWSARWSELDAIKSDLESRLETISIERDELSGMLQRERETGCNEKLTQLEEEYNVARSEWEAEKERLEARIDEQNEALLESSRSAMAAKDELREMRVTAEETVDAWKRKFYVQFWTCNASYSCYCLNG